MFIWNTISLTAIPLAIYPFIVALLTPGDIQEDFLFMGIGLVASQLVVLAAKHGTKELGPDFVRPAGATDCNALCNDGSVQGAPGFPSGHMTTVLFLFTYLLVLSIYHNKVMAIRGVIVLVGSLATTAVAMARYHKKCHTPFQIVSGALLGVASALVWFVALYA